MKKDSLALYARPGCLNDKIRIWPMYHNAIADIKPVITPTHQRFRQNCDTIIARSANPILEKLCFRVISPPELTGN